MLEQDDWEFCEGCDRKFHPDDLFAGLCPECEDDEDFWDDEPSECDCAICQGEKED